LAALAAMLISAHGQERKRLVQRHVGQVKALKDRHFAEWCAFADQHRAVRMGPGRIVRRA
jgi:hypothetical protein